MFLTALLRHFEDYEVSDPQGVGTRSSHYAGLVSSMLPLDITVRYGDLFHSLSCRKNVLAAVVSIVMFMCISNIIIGI